MFVFVHITSVTHKFARGKHFVHEHDGF